MVVHGKSLRQWRRHFLYFERYGWGWEIGFMWRWWLVMSRCDWPCLYVSNDATPPCDRNRGFYVWRAKSIS